MSSRLCGPHTIDTLRPASQLQVPAEGDPAAGKLGGLHLPYIGIHPCNTPDQKHSMNSCISTLTGLACHTQTQTTSIHGPSEGSGSTAARPAQNQRVCGDTLLPQYSWSLNTCLHCCLPRHGTSLASLTLYTCRYTCPSMLTAAGA